MYRTLFRASEQVGAEVFWSSGMQVWVPELRVQEQAFAKHKRGRPAVDFNDEAFKQKGLYLRP